MSALALSVAMRATPDAMSGCWQAEWRNMSVKKADQRLLPVGLPLRLDRYEEDVVTSVTATCSRRGVEPYEDEPAKPLTGTIAVLAKGRDQLQSAQRMPSWEVEW